MVLSEYDSRFHVVSASLNVRFSVCALAIAHISKRFGFRVKKFVPFQSVGAEQRTNLFFSPAFSFSLPLGLRFFLFWHEEVAEVESSCVHAACLSAAMGVTG